MSTLIKQTDEVAARDCQKKAPSVMRRGPELMKQMI